MTEPTKECECLKCLKAFDDKNNIGCPPLWASRMISCESCGNKRCPKATDHDLVCTDSNEPGQAGSIYGVPNG